MQERRIDWIAKHAANQPEKLSLIEIGSGTRLNYRQLDDRINRLALYLENLGIRPGDRIAALTRISREPIEMQYAAWRIGAVFVPVNNRLAQEELVYVLNNAAPAAILVDAGFTDVLESVRHRLRIDHWISRGIEDGETDHERIIAKSAPLANPRDFAADTFAQIIYSSGTTGRPKGVVHSHRTLMYALLCRIVPGSVDRETVALCSMPLFHISGLNGMVNATLMAGGTVILLEKFCADRLLELVNDESLGITYLFAVPTMLDVLRKHPQVDRADFSRIRTCFTGTAPVPRELIAWWIERGVPISQAYGMTETAAATSLASVGDNLKHPDTIGKPVLFADFRIVLEDGSDAGPEEVGELWLRSPSTMVGYWKNPAATAETFHDGWLKTGDLACVDQEGYYFVKGRRKEMYISGGENVYPAEVEGVLRQMPEIHQAAVVGIPDQKWGETGCAAVVPEPGAPVTMEKIASFCETRLARFKWPGYVVLLEELPTNSTGKIDKLLIREIVLKRLAGQVGPSD